MKSNAFPISAALQSLPVLVALVSFGLVGCGSEIPVDPGNAPQLPAFKPESTIDAGIIFFGAETYQCFPLSRFGIHQPSDIDSIETSCDCIQASIIQFSSIDGKADYGLRLQFMDDSNGSEARPFSLAARVNLLLRDQTQKEVTVRFLHTFLDPQESES